MFSPIIRLCLSGVPRSAYGDGESYGRSVGRASDLEVRQGTTAVRQPGESQQAGALRRESTGTYL